MNSRICCMHFYTTLWWTLRFCFLLNNTHYYCNSRQPENYEGWGRVLWDPIYWFNSTTLLCLSQARTWISFLICCGLFLCWDVFVDIIGIVDIIVLILLLYTSNGLSPSWYCCMLPVFSLMFFRGVASICILIVLLLNIWLVYHIFQHCLYHNYFLLQH